MSSDLANINAFHDYENQQVATLNVPLVLALTGALIGLLLVCSQNIVFLLRHYQTL
jgi:hypothetical protein